MAPCADPRDAHGGAGVELSTTCASLVCSCVGSTASSSRAAVVQRGAGFHEGRTKQALRHRRLVDVRARTVRPLSAAVSSAQTAELTRSPAFRYRVYDITSFIKSHPGGDVIGLAMGRDSTALFETYHPTGAPVKVRFTAVPSRLRGLWPECGCLTLQGSHQVFDRHAEVRRSVRVILLLGGANSRLHHPSETCIGDEMRASLHGRAALAGTLAAPGGTHPHTHRFLRADLLYGMPQSPFYDTLRQRVVARLRELGKVLLHTECLPSSSAWSPTARAHASVPSLHCTVPLGPSVTAYLA